MSQKQGRHLTGVDLVFTFSDGETIKAFINVEDGEWSQWNATTAELGENVATLDAIRDAIAEAQS